MSGTGLLSHVIERGAGGMVLSQARQDMTSLRAAVEAALAQLRTYTA